MLDPSKSKKFLKLMSRGICYADKEYAIGESINKGAFKDLLLLVNLDDSMERIYVDPNPDVSLKVEESGTYAIEIEKKWPADWAVDW